MKKIIFFFVFVISNVFAQQKSIFDIARNGTLEELEMAYKTNPDCINTINDGKSSPLILACYHGNNKVALFLLNNIKDINYNSGMGTALMAAVVKGNLPLVKAIIKKGANLNLTDVQGMTALMYAVQFKHTVVVAVLLQYKADKTLVSKEGKTAFEYAIASGDKKLVKLLN